MRHNTEAHESAMKAGKELVALLDYFPISAWLQVADTTMRPLVYVQVPEVVEIVKQAQDVIDKKKPKEGESPIEEIIAEQNLPDMMQLRHIWGYGREDIGKKMVSVILYKYLMERMMPKQHVPTHFLLTRFATTESTLHKYIVGTEVQRWGSKWESTGNQVNRKEWTSRQWKDATNDVKQAGQD